MTGQGRGPLVGIVGWGVRQLFGGAREGNAGLTGLGAAVAIFGWLRTRSRNRPSRDLLYVANLVEGETLKVRYMKGRTVVDETEIEG